MRFLLSLIVSCLIAPVAYSNCTTSEIHQYTHPYTNQWLNSVLTECDASKLLDGTKRVSIFKDKIKIWSLSYSYLTIGDIYWDASDGKWDSLVYSTKGTYNALDKMYVYFRDSITHEKVTQEWAITRPTIYSDSLQTSQVTLNGLDNQKLTKNGYQICYKSSGFYGYSYGIRKKTGFKTFRSKFEDGLVQADSADDLHKYTMTPTETGNWGEIRESDPKCYKFNLASLTPQIHILDFEAGDQAYPIETSGRFRIQLHSFDAFDEATEHKLFENIDGSGWVEHSIITEQFNTVLLAQSGSVSYKVQSCVAGLCTDSNEISLRYEATPSEPEVIARSKQIKQVTGEMLSWNPISFPSNSTLPQYKIRWEKLDLQTGEKQDAGELTGITSTQLLLDFVDSGYRYRFYIQACNATCSAYVPFVDDKNGESLFTVSYVPGGYSAVEVLDETGVPLLGESETGRFTLRLTNLNAANFQVYRSGRVIAGSIYNEIEHKKWVPVSIDPTLIIPISSYETEIVNTYNSFIPAWPFEISKSVNQSSIDFDVTEERNGTYTYIVYACNIFNDCILVNNGLNIEVNILVVTPEQVIFDGEELSVSGNYEQEYKDRITKIYLRDENDRIVHEVIVDEQGFETALDILKANMPDDASGYSVGFCSDIGCSNPIDITTAPDVPKYINVAVNDTTLGHGQVVTWGAVEGAESYTLILRVETYDYDSGEKIINEIEIDNISETSYVFDDESPMFGQHFYKVHAENIAGTSGYSYEVTLVMEPDPTAFIRSLLYYAHEDDSGNIVPESAEEADPVSGIYNRDNAAFRYLDLMYTKSADNFVIINGNGNISIGSGITDANGASLYGDEERERALRAEKQVKILLGSDEFFSNTSVQKLLLDIYFDRSTAEVYLANMWLDRARVLRFTDQQNPNNFYDEVEFVTSARDLFKNVLFGCDSSLGETCFTPGYQALFQDALFSQYLADYSPSRGQISPRYWQKNVANKVEPDASEKLLAAGYKDVRLMYEIMTGYLESSVEEAKLKVIAGGADLVSLDITESELITSRNSLAQLDEMLYEDYSAAFGNTDWNGLIEARSRYLDAYTKVGNAINWLSGANNYLGVPNDLVILKHDDALPNNDSFDNYVASISGPYSAFSEVESAIDLATQHYDTFRANNDTASTHRENYIATWAGKLLELTGYDCSEIDSREIEQQCFAQGNGWPVSEISLQAQTLELAINNVELAEAQLDALQKSINGKINDLVEFRRANNKALEITLLYGELESNLNERMDKISIDAQRRQARNNSKVGLGDVVGAIGGGGGDPFLSMANFVGTVESKHQAYKSAKIGISASKRIGELSRLSAELELERQVRIQKLTNQIQEASLASQIKNMWLEVNLQAIKIEQAQLNVEMEADKLTILFNKAQYALEKIRSNSEELMNRYFADPVHARRVTSYMDQAYDVFERAQLELYLAANALEYRLGVDLNGGALVFRKTDIFKARTLEDLKDFLRAMNQLAENGIDSEPADAMISLKKDILGYTTVIQDNQELSIYEDPSYVGPIDEMQYLNAESAFSRKIQHSFDVFKSYLDTGDLAGYEAAHDPNDPIKYMQAGTDTYMKVRFNTENGFYRATGGKLFNGVVPNLTKANEGTCYLSSGTYRDKIEKSALLMTMRQQRPDVSELSATMFYGGVGYYRPKNPPPLNFYTEPGGEGIFATGANYLAQLDAYKTASQLYFDDLSGLLSIGESDLSAHLMDYLTQLDNLNALAEVYNRSQDVIPFNIRYWEYKFSTGKFEETSQKGYSIEMKVSGPSVGTPDLTGYYTDQLKERSVAVSDWVFRFPIKTLNEGDVIKLADIKDIELLIDYTYLDRNAPSAELCDPF